MVHNVEKERDNNIDPEKEEAVNVFSKLNNPWYPLI